MKRFKVKPEYEKFYNTLIANNLDSTFGCKIFEVDSMFYKLLKDANVLDRWCEEIEDKWEDLHFIMAVSPNIGVGALSKARLLIRMQSWADFYNKVDGFVPDFGDGDQDKYGIELQDKEAELEFHQTCNAYLFQIALVSVERAAQMRDYFKSDIQSLIDQNLI